ncbi:MULTISPECIES: WD40 repeat domain-containing serine/threonine-protein kinase [unclassified Tolypothrix]|uniref:WD40 repeat domain-containing serine/threonine-protein kinase n=1 Tax=unclassified Tolypothrix TaxID=2649714 RepID=UPI0005EAB820|nr:MULTISPECIES: WD40 repeat domain-containing serine/threonine-protein kinase [unclassified Tolypothrix]BAY91614.1 serine/threonine protein kinase with WD-40 repeats [Microchaete diplosiphon NIES-3275]EKF05286.1 serine/threonine protein kinase [Tolypothrix sp. PCC 7601]MBE9087137.1 protein kinase [Tolypothrix sp. LEGE 11397]UYD25637.1 protein kinase [Tolypothrix sp. PCC 7712]UYD32122.1 protein kinase [Tolypothrix sp. PCC 7601]
MTYCLNPNCDQPVNPQDSNFCQGCGIKLTPLLRNRYCIIQPLGGGGFGRTFLAADEDKLKEHCVVKQLSPQVKGTNALRKATELFKEEARRLQQLGEHPQIPTLYAYFGEDSYLYLVQQFIQGQSLRQELKQQGTFSEAKIWQLLGELLPVLDFVHENQVIHRDIKPDNIMRRSPQSQSTGGNLVLIDFGVSKQVTATSMELTGTSIGSYGYAPMEQMKYGLASPASDLFSLGVTCFSLLTGIQPSHLYMEAGYNWVKSWREHLKHPISAQLEQILDKLLQKEVEHRYQSANAVLQDLPQQTQQKTLLQDSTGKIKVSGLNLKAATHLQKLLGKTQLPYQLLMGGAIVLLGWAGYGYWQSLPLTGHGGEVNTLAFVPISPSSRSQRQQPNVALLPLQQIATAKEGILASGSDDQTVKIWNLQQKQVIRTLKADSGWVYAVAITPDSQTAIAGYKNHTIKIWNLNTGKEIRTLKGHRDLVNSVAITPDGQTVVSGSYDKTIKIWDLATGKEIRTLKEHTREVLAVAISPDGEKIASASADRTIKIWQLKTGKEIHTLKGHSLDVNALAISPNGQLLASASDDKTIKLWNLNTGKLIRTFDGHTADVNAIAFSPNGEYIASASDDKTVKVWQKTTGEVIKTFQGHTAEVYAVAFSPNGKTLVSGSKDKTIKIWHLP